MTGRPDGPDMSPRAAQVAALLLNHPLCLNCLANQTELGPLDLDRVLTALSAVLRVDWALDRCRVCDMETATTSVTRPGR